MQDYCSHESGYWNQLGILTIKYTGGVRLNESKWLMQMKWAQIDRSLYVLVRNLLSSYTYAAL